MKNLTRKTTFYGTDDEIKNRPNFKITKQRNTSSRNYDTDIPWIPFLLDSVSF